MSSTDLDLRQKALEAEERRMLIANLSGSEQERGLTRSLNCQGYGRTRHFKIHRYDDWSPDPLPNLPAAKALGRPPEDILRAQVFPIAVCNWNCWYCFVDVDRRNANKAYSNPFTAEELVDLMLEEDSWPDVSDLSGGQPDIVPEWTLWMMEALTQRGIEIDDMFLSS